ncbi:DUF992 domain-containing protein [Reyranella aquatilis]|uniref:DUF992 domain-containing protein n=1 Tax=Reyranella aquatilis TaxID=2035356 RepID=A0ABS8KXN6_9HYPH|nr:DUF992 domain-containing protein [Reyranella aquatilis]MCC8430368.1 DUF992 domain-containing protein [Reyranella aquatilis]
MFPRILRASAAMAILAAFAAPAAAQTKSGVNAGSLTCTVSGGVGFVFGSSKELTCLFSRSNGMAERYTGTIKKFGLDVGFTKEAQIVWLVFAPGSLSSGALAGVYAGATASATAGAGVGANVLVGGSNNQVSLQPVSVEGSVGLNVAAGIAEVELRAVK